MQIRVWSYISCSSGPIEKWLRNDVATLGSTTSPWRVRMTLVKSGSVSWSARVIVVVGFQEEMVFVWRSGRLDNASATWFSFPGRYLISWLYSSRYSDHRACLG